VGTVLGKLCAEEGHRMRRGHAVGDSDFGGSLAKVDAKMPSERKKKLPVPKVLIVEIPYIAFHVRTRFGKLQDKCINEK